MSNHTLGIVFFGDSTSLFSNRLFHPLYKMAKKKPETYVLRGVVDTPKEGWVSTNAAAMGEEESFLNGAASLGAPVVLPTEEYLAPLQADLFVAVGYTQVLREPLLSMPAQYTVNFHASLLPAFRGKHPVFRALQAGMSNAGLSVHVMDASLDTGPLLYQCRVKVKRRDSVASLYQRIIKKSMPLMTRLLKEAVQKSLRPVPQGTEGASYFSSITDEDYHIRFDTFAHILEHRVYATPGKCYFLREGRKVYLLGVQATLRECPQLIGQIGAGKGERFRVSVPGGSLLVGRVCEEGGHEETGAAYCRRAGLSPGMFIEGAQNG